MPEIIPFKAYRYNMQRFKSLADVLSPPYDVISAKEQEELYKKNPYNFVRLDLKKNGGGESVYEAAARELNDWIKRGIFVPEQKSALYVYVQIYKNQAGKESRRVGLLALMKIDAKKVRKHEHTLAGPKADRMALMEHVQANMSPIFGFFEDAGKKVHNELLGSAKKGRKPEIDVTIAGVRHMLYVETDPARQKRITAALKPKPMYIADGHHRFEVSSQYALKNGKENKAARYVLTYLCSAEHNDMTIYPTHRVLSLGEASWRGIFERAVHDNFESKEWPNLGKLTAFLEKESQKSVVMGAALKEGRGITRFLSLKVKKKTKDLDVMVAGKLLIEPLLEGEEVQHSKKIRYTRDAQEALTWVDSGESDLAIFLPKMPIQQIVRVSDAGINLPQKSTYFYPKLLSGLLIYKFDTINKGLAAVSRC